MARPRTRKEPVERLLLKISRLYFEEGKSMTEIARNLQISVTHVGRLIREAQERGIVQISIRSPGFHDLELALVERYRLQDVRVVASSESEDVLRRDLGIRAADFFEEAVSEGARIGVGSGRTLFEMIQSVRERSRDISIFPLTTVAERGLNTRSISANTLANILWFKSRPSASAYTLSLCLPDCSAQEIAQYLRSLRHKPSIDAFCRALQELDFYFFSASHLRPDSELIELAETTGKDIDTLRRMGITGDYLFNTIDANGEDLPCGVEAYLINLALVKLQKLSQDAQCQTILIAGGQEKVEIIRAGLSSRLFKILITDDRSARSLL
jgi:deoxyribonucleoside regulator